MNEIELIRTQLATERMHLREIAATCDGPGDGPARREYLHQVLGWFAERDERLGQLLQVPNDLGEEARAALAEALAAPGSSREALQRLPDGAGGSTLEWRAFAQFVAGDWDSRRGRLDALLSRERLVSTWRAIAGIDADTVLEERALYARARAPC